MIHAGADLGGEAWAPACRSCFRVARMRAAWLAGGRVPLSLRVFLLQPLGQLPGRGGRGGPARGVDRLRLRRRLVLAVCRYCRRCALAGGASLPRPPRHLPARPRPAWPAAWATYRGVRCPGRPAADRGTPSRAGAPPSRVVHGDDQLNARRTSIASQRGQLDNDVQALVLTGPQV